MCGVVCVGVWGGPGCTGDQGGRPGSTLSGTLR